MKRIITTVLFLACVAGAIAQQSTMVKSAQKNYTKKKIPAAVEAIRAAMLNPETLPDAATYLVQARIYVAASNPPYSKNFPKAEDTALIALQKTLLLDSSETNFFLAESEIVKLSAIFYEKGSA